MAPLVLEPGDLSGDPVVKVEALVDSFAEPAKAFSGQMAKSGFPGSRT